MNYTYTETNRKIERMFQIKYLVMWIDNNVNQYVHPFPNMYSEIM